MTTNYSGPLRDEPLAVELHNTVYVAGGAPVDGLADPAQARAWLREIGRRLPSDGPPGDDPSPAELAELRGAVRTALQAAVGGGPVDAAALATINRVSMGAPASPLAVPGRSGSLVKRIDHRGAARGEVILAAFARDAIELLTDPHRHTLRVCGAPNCVLLFERDHPRREWCSNACGNRARQARHYQRVRHG